MYLCFFISIHPSVNGYYLPVDITGKAVLGKKIRQFGDFLRLSEPREGNFIAQGGLFFLIEAGVHFCVNDPAAYGVDPYAAQADLLGQSLCE